MSAVDRLAETDEYDIQAEPISLLSYSSHGCSLENSPAQWRVLNEALAYGCEHA